jgi:hypothetical protein
VLESGEGGMFLVSRYKQIVLWIILGLLVGAIQSVASFLPVMVEKGDLGSRDLRLVLAGVALVYGGGWFVPALLVSDVAILRRTLSRDEFSRYTLLIAVTAVFIGICMPGMMLMLGYPTTACLILAYGFMYRKRA